MTNAAATILAAIVQSTAGSKQGKTVRRMAALLAVLESDVLSEEEEKKAKEALMGCIGHILEGQD